MESNRIWAFTEAKRRAKAMEDAYSIYRLNHAFDDYIVRNANAEKPNGWTLVATWQPDGSQSFGLPVTAK